MGNERKPSITYFRTPPCHYTCAQAIIKGFQQEFGISDEEIDQFANFGGGRAPEGICGSLYAANCLLERINEGPVNAAFAAKAGSDKCQEIKFTYRFPCPDCVRLADELVDEKIKNKQK
ncbi:MAG: C-GCAxxG-C-C family protein [Paludibacteraceae bacterium]|nr:C-GCAxxG-C-C family protein [Paludibacteraceae bacterium]